MSCSAYTNTFCLLLQHAHKAVPFCFISFIVFLDEYCGQALWRPIPPSLSSQLHKLIKRRKEEKRTKTIRSELPRPKKKINPKRTSTEYCLHHKFLLSTLTITLFSSSLAFCTVFEYRLPAISHQMSSTMMNPPTQTHV